MGPFPTIAIGNTGPTRQSAGDDYAVDQVEDVAESTHIVVRQGRMFPMGRLLYVPVSAVQSLSQERIVLAVGRSQIPEEWRHRPTR